MKMKAEIYRPGDAKDASKPTSSWERERLGPDPPSGCSDGTTPADTLASGFQPPDGEMRHGCCLSRLVWGTPLGEP